MNPRLNPPSCHSRWHHFNALRNALIEESRLLSLNKSSGSTVLDLGCGSTPYREIFVPLVTQYLGADIDMNPYADLQIDISGRVPVEDSSIDVILSTQVLEHVPVPRSYLLEARRLLKPNGRIILSTHGYWMYHPDPVDYWRWTKAGLRKVIEEAGFQVESVRGVMNLASTGLQLFQDGLASNVPSPLLPIFYYVVQRVVGLLDKLGSDESRNRDACIFVVRAINRKQC
jgi:SAM-dependent methyltransferase